MLQILKNARVYMWSIRIGLLILLGLFWQANLVSADDCDNWGRLIHVGASPGDSFCMTRSGSGGSTTKQLEDKRDFDYFLFYLGYDDETPVGARYRIALTNTNLSRPKITVGTFYDDAPAGNDLTGAEVWYNEYSGSLGGMTLDEFKKMVTLAPNLQHDGVYDYVNGEIVVVQESSGAATRQLFYRVPVGTNLATNAKGDYSVTFTPPDRGAYVVIVSNYNPTRSKGRLTGAYTLSVSLD